ncbi:kelch repeat and BTB domain-containing protein 7 [Protopterus annectens]|uniref:kelch repeat and BTB domain-containing protein 7 n=1 Tax=Protopterus annectens TaxID=7888 RepID=UPI001CFA3C0D|nr:kelch repeat and BTB domain-containing protein 7 [Protopterus annectens]
MFQKGMASVHDLFSGPEELEDENHARSLLKELKVLYDSEQLFDVIIEVIPSFDRYSFGPDRGKLFRCNRNVLAAASPYFKSMFTGGLYESKQKQVTIHDVDTESMALIIDYCYTGKVTVSESNVQPLYAAANMLQLEYIRQACISFMTRRMDLSNCAGILKFADAFDSQELKSKALAFIARNFRHLYQNNEELMDLNLNQIKEVLLLSNLDVESERKVFFFAVRWIESNVEERSVCSPEVFKCIRWHSFGDDGKEYVEELLRSKSLIRKHCQDFIEDMLTAKFDNLEGTKRIGMLAEEMVIFFGHPKEPFLCYNPYFGHVFAMPSPLNTLTHSRNCTSSAVCVSTDNDLYLAAQPSKQLWVYNAVINTWQQLPDRLLARDGMDIGYLNGFIYIMGGRDPFTGVKIKDVECYNIRKNQWKLVAELPHTLYAFELIALDGYLYAVSSKRMLRFDPDRNCWVNCASLKCNEFREACVFNGEIYCICDMPVVKVYNPASGEWRRICDIPVDGNTEHVQIVTCNNKCLLITTTTPQWKRNRITVHEYDIKCDEWVSVGTMLGLLHYDSHFICLSALVYPCNLQTGKNFLSEDLDVHSESSGNWDFEDLSDDDSESYSSSSLSEDRD